MILAAKTSETFLRPGITIRNRVYHRFFVEKASDLKFYNYSFIVITCLSIETKVGVKHFSFLLSLTLSYIVSFCLFRHFFLFLFPTKSSRNSFLSVCIQRSGDIEYLLNQISSFSIKALLSVAQSFVGIHRMIDALCCTSAAIFDGSEKILTSVEFIVHVCKQQHRL